VDARHGIRYTVYIRCIWQGNHVIYGHTRCVPTVLANPTHLCCVELKYQHPSKGSLIPNLSCSTHPTILIPHTLVSSALYCMELKPHHPSKRSHTPNHSALPHVLVSVGLADPTHQYFVDLKPQHSSKRSHTPNHSAFPHALVSSVWCGAEIPALQQQRLSHTKALLFRRRLFDLQCVELDLQ